MVEGDKNSTYISDTTENEIVVLELQCVENRNRPQMSRCLANLYEAQIKCQGDFQ
jgi:hypothetical protein